MTEKNKLKKYSLSKGQALPYSSSAVLRTLMFVVISIIFSIAHSEDGLQENTSLDKFLLSTPQINNVLYPLENVQVDAVSLKVHASVVTVADPLETRLGRVFDVQLSSLIRAYHSQGFVLDSFALTWKPLPLGDSVNGKRIPDAGTGEFGKNHRSRPSVLVFRNDLWRKAQSEEAVAKKVDYRVIFLVGESPTFGLHPEALKLAIYCAAQLNQIAGNPDLLRNSCPPEGQINDNDSSHESIKEDGKPETLHIIGPSFSGSMQSLAAAIGQSIDKNASFDVNVISPTATVHSNKYLARALGHVSNNKNNNFSYESMAESLWVQLQELCEFAEFDILNKGSDRNRVPLNKYKMVVFAEESTFGRGVIDLINQWIKEREDDIEDNTFKITKAYDINEKQLTDCFKRIRVVSFPQNVSAIRAERNQEDRQTSDSWMNMLQLRKRMLELDFSSFDESTDRPPAYLRQISSRSDELMLYHTFDALRVWVKPVLVAIVATDVRDRLFILNEVRKSLPAALPVLLEMDYLTAHPDYRKISRGSLVLPHGPTLLCLDRKDWLMVECKNRDIDKSYFAFPADYAANMFRSVYCLLRKQELRNSQLCSEIETADKELKQIQELISPRPSQPRVHTLAGFQTLKEGVQYSSLLAADSRLALQWIFLGLIFIITLPLLIIALRLQFSKSSDTVMISLLRGASQWIRIDPDVNDKTQSDSLAGDIKWISWAPPVLLFLILILYIIIFIEVKNLFFIKPYLREWSLAHGRDKLALLSLFLLYIWIAIRGGWRLDCLISRHSKLRELVYIAQFQNSNNKLWKYYILFFILFVTVFTIFAVALWFGNNQRFPTTVDSLFLPLFVNCTLLSLSVVFLLLFYCQSKKWLRLSTFLARTIHVVNKYRAKQEKSDIEQLTWPSPMILGQDMQSPFGLAFRYQDLLSFSNEPGMDLWSEQTRDIISGKWPCSNSECGRFNKWQDRLVAEMRYASVAVRSSAWCGILAPIILLIAMNVYPTVGERLITSVSVGLIVVGFAIVMYVALKVEQNPLLSRMFTIHDDRLTFGHVVGALWPKLLAITLILIPILFPGFLEWIFSLMKSINSL